MDSTTACNIIMILIGLSIALASAEQLHNREVYRDGQLLPWKHLKYAHSMYSKRFPEFLDRTFKDVTLLLLTRLELSCTLVVFVWFSVPPFFILLPLFVTTVIFNLRNVYSNNGADQVITVALMAMTIATISSGVTYLKPVSLNFVAAEVSVAYLVSGFYKLNKNWLNGKYLIGVMSTEIFGHKLMYRLLKKRIKLASLLSITMILTEIMLGFAFLLPPKICIVLVCLGMLFHFLTAFIMGLNIFFFAFVLTYPAIYYTSLHGIVIPQIKI